MKTKAKSTSSKARKAKRAAQSNNVDVETEQDLSEDEFEEARINFTDVISVSRGIHGSSIRK